MVKWEETADTNKTWENWKNYFRYIYAKKKRYKKETGKKDIFESASNMREKHIISKDSICDMFKELSNTSRVD